MISIISPLWNVEDYLRETIESVLNQTYSDFELILVDDGSTDRTPSIVEEYAKKDPRVIPVSTGSNRGVSYARNDGVQRAKGDLISFIDGDDFWDPKFLEILLEELNKADLNCLGVFSWSTNVNAKIVNRSEYHRPEKGAYFLSRMLLKRCPPGNGSCLLIRKRAFEEVGLFDVSMRVGSDAEMWLRMLAAAPGKYYFLCVPLFLTFRRIRPGQLTATFYSEDRILSWNFRLEKYLKFIQKRERIVTLLTYTQIVILAGGGSFSAVSSWLERAKQECDFRFFCHNPAFLPVVIMPARTFLFLGQILFQLKTILVPLKRKWVR